MTTKLTKLIDGDTGELIDRAGEVIERVGIFDVHGNEYAGGMDSAGVIFGAVVNENNHIVLFDGGASRWLVGGIYVDDSDHCCFDPHCCVCGA